MIFTIAWILSLSLRSERSDLGENQLLCVCVSIGLNAGTVGGWRELAGY